MRLALVAILGVVTSSCAATSQNSASNGSPTASRSVAESTRQSSAPRAADPCDQAIQSQTGAAVAGALLGAVGDLAPYSSRNGWAVNRAAYAGQRVAGTAEAAAALESDRRC